MLSSGCGALLNFIGATFLVLYKSTMQQATENVAILERITAVGMSLQVLKQLKDGGEDLFNEGIADLAQEPLKVFRGKP